MNHRLILGNLGLAAILVAVPGVTSTQGQELGSWRSAWRITLSAREPQGIPASFTLRFENRGDVSLEGRNAAFTLYVKDTVYGWAVDPVLRAKILEIPPGGVITETVAFGDLKFTDVRGNDLDPKSVATLLRDSAWKTSVAVLDVWTPKSPYESNLTVWSNWVSFNDTRRDAAD